MSCGRNSAISTKVSIPHNHISNTNPILEMPREKIKVVLPDGKEKEGTSFETTPLDIAKSISNSLPDKVVVAKVKYLKRVGTLDQGLVNPDAEKDEQGEHWELYDSFRPFEGDCELKLI